MYFKFDLINGLFLILIKLYWFVPCPGTPAQDPPPPPTPPNGGSTSTTIVPSDNSPLDRLCDSTGGNDYFAASILFPVHFFFLFYYYYLFFIFCWYRLYNLRLAPIIYRLIGAALIGIFYAPPPSVTGEVYCFPRRQLIFSFGRRVIYHLKVFESTFRNRFRLSVPRSSNE